MNKAMTSAQKYRSPGEHRFELTGGALCLDFANTLGDRPRGSEEHLATYQDLLAFARQSGIVEGAEAEALVRYAASHPTRARNFFRRALALRECLYRSFSAIARRRSPAKSDLDSLNQGLAESMSRLRVEPKRGGFGWSWHGADGELDRALWPILRSAGELLTAEEHSWVRECAGSTCSWLFIDRSRTRRRRWCSMRTCGNRAKARRFYHRQKARRKSS